LIQHKIDLFSAGFEHNATAKIDLDDSQKALTQYKSGVDSLSPIEERVVDNLPPEYLSTKAVGGIHAIINSDSASLFALGSASRGIPYKQWEIKLPTSGPQGCGFCPRADIFATAKLEGVRYVR
jgi:hypothetical protein